MRPTNEIYKYENPTEAHQIQEIKIVATISTKNNAK